MNEKFWIDVLSGSRRSLAAGVLRGLLWGAEPGYYVATLLRNWAYDRQLPAIGTLPVPVLSVGNLTTGGTGKTPTVAWLVGECQRMGLQPGILSRGYRSLDEDENDEKRLLDRLCPHVPHVQNRDRVAAGQELLGQSCCDVLVLDDGFQHRRLARQMDLVLVDALNPWGYGHLLPRGLLRESLAGLRRASAVLLTRCEQASPETVSRITAEVARWTSAPVIKTRFQPLGLVNSVGEKQPCEALQGCRVGAFCGIGNPAGFQQTLFALGLLSDSERLRRFPDHHHYSAADLTSLGEWAAAEGLKALVTTGKDLVKIPEPKLGDCLVWGVDIGLEFVDPAEQQQLQLLIQKCVTGPDGKG